jgi:hypothetical protein
MSIKSIGLAALAATLAIGLGGAADAASKKKQRIVRDDTGIGNFVIGRGDSRALINRSYPNIDANPPSLTGTYNLRGRKMQESRN